MLNISNTFCSYCPVLVAAAKPPFVSQSTGEAMQGSITLVLVQIHDINECNR